MCGINGFNWQDENLIKEMNTKIAHRGPDDSGIFLSSGISLGHQRLAIIDLTPAAHQPMTSRDGRYVIVYNGELYNFKDIKTELNEYEFISNSDTEVILYAYAKWGSECLQKFNGIFSFAIWDKDRAELFLARDQFGVKPLYYYNEGGKFIFSSEAKAIFEHSQVKREINFDAFNNYFRFLYVLGPETMWQSIKKLPLASFAVVSGGRIEIKKYYEIKRERFYGDYNAVKGTVRRGIGRAVQRQLISDRPVGLFLSGGLDSSIICAVMAKENSSPIKTFSVGFETHIEAEKFNADFNIAQKTAAYFGTAHTPVVISAKDVADEFENCIISMDEPVSNHIQVATYMLAKEAKKQVAVVLGGDGGDEIFGGYDRYYYMYILGKLRRSFPFIKNKCAGTILSKFIKESSLQKLCAASDAEVFLSFMSQKENFLASFIKPEYNSPAAKSIYNGYLAGDYDLAESAMRADTSTWLVDESLIRSDKLTMAHGLEERVPFLDKDLVELAFSLPTRLKLKNREQGKKILREAVADIVPAFILEEKKRGFFSPAAKWLRAGLRPMVYEILSPSYNDKTKELFNWNKIRDIIDRHMDKREYALNTIWSLMTFQAWARNYL